MCTYCKQITGCTADGTEDLFCSNCQDYFNVTLRKQPLEWQDSGYSERECLSTRQNSVQCTGNTDLQRQPIALDYLEIMETTESQVPPLEYLVVEADTTDCTQLSVASDTSHHAESLCWETKGELDPHRTAEGPGNKYTSKEQVTVGIHRDYDRLECLPSAKVAISDQHSDYSGIRNGMDENRAADSDGSYYDHLSII